MRAGLMGAGRIGWTYDGGRWDGGASTTYVSSLARHPRTDLVAVYDADTGACRAFEAAFPEIFVTSNLEEFLLQKLEIVCIASPTQFHCDHLDACFDAHISHIMVEKPVAPDIDSFTKIAARWRSLVVRPRVQVNYFRRSLFQSRLLKSQIQNRNIFGIEISYSRKLTINGVHLLDLLGFLTESSPPTALDWHLDRGENPSFGFRLGDVSVAVTGYDLPYHLLEIRVIAEDGRVTFARGGSAVISEAKEPTEGFPGFFKLSKPEGLVDETQAAQALNDGLYMNLCELLDDSAAQCSTLETAAFSQSILDLVAQI